MQNNTQIVLDHIIKAEGGYVNHPKDPGGATNMGITLKTLQAWRGQPLTVDAVKNLKRSEAEDIYKTEYMRPVRFDDLPSGLDYAVVDFAVHSGVKRAAEYLQYLVMTTQDGIIGPKTLAALDKFHIPRLVNLYCDERLEFLNRLKSKTFRDGWAKRVKKVRATAVKMAYEGLADG